MDMNESPLQKPLSCTGCKGTLFGVVGYCPFCGVPQPESVIETDPGLEVALPPPTVVVESVQGVDPVQSGEAGQVEGADPEVDSDQDEDSGQDQERGQSHTVRRRRRQKLSTPPTTVPTPGQGADRTPMADAAQTGQQAQAGQQTQVTGETPVLSQAPAPDAAQTADAAQTGQQTQAGQQTQVTGETLRPVPFYWQPRFVAVGALVVLVVLVFSFMMLRSRNADGLVSLYGQAEQAFNSKDIATAKSNLDEFLRLVPSDKRGLALRDRIADLQRRHEALYKEAKTLATKKGDVAAATKRLTVIVNEDVSNRSAQALLQSLAQVGRPGGADCQSYEEQVELALGQKDFIKAQYLANAAREGKCSQASALNTRVKREGEAVPLWVRENTSFAFEELTRAKNQITSGKKQEGRRMAEAVIKIYGRDAEVLQEAQNVLSMAQ